MKLMYNPIIADNAPNIEEIKIVINGAGAAGIAIAKFLIHLGAKDLILVDRNGILSRDEKQSNTAKEEIALLTNHKIGRASCRERV